MKTIRDLLDAEGTDEVPAVEHLLGALDENGAIVTWLHGSPGSGKKDLLAEFGRRAVDANIVELDCRTIEPTPAGLARELGDEESVDAIASRLSDLAKRVVLVFRHYEVLRLTDSWLRRELLPSLATNTRVILSSSEKPSAGWLSARSWRAHFSVVSLGDGDPAVAAQRMLDEASTPELRKLLEDLSVVRRLTKPLLATLRPDLDADTAWDEVGSLSFVDRQRDGLAIASVLQREMSASLRAADPDRYRDLQRRAWRFLRGQLKHATCADLWRTTADTIYLIENPVIREAFFPSQSAGFSVDPAVSSDLERILDIASVHEPAAGVDALQLWWKHLPSSFHTVRDAEGNIVGFYCAARPEDLANNWMTFDPVAKAWQAHLSLSPASARPDSLFLRRWLSASSGEAPCGEQAAAWVDIKRTYLELRPALRRVYLTLFDLAPYAAVASELGFKVLDDATVTLDQQKAYTAMLDFGPASVDGWIGNLVAAELGINKEQLLDAATRELVLGDARIPLTPLEYGVLSMLDARDGTAVSRKELLKQVWGHSYDGGSNVVDAVVRGLRRKCGESADIVETVRGVGYRLRMPA